MKTGGLFSVVENCPICAQIVMDVQIFDRFNLLLTMNNIEKIIIKPAIDSGGGRNITFLNKHQLSQKNKINDLESQYHDKEWSVEEDALAFLTDAGLVGRLTMAKQERWPTAVTFLSQRK